MIAFIFQAGIIILAIILAVTLLRSSMNKRFILRAFERGSVIVTGHKRRGKDMLFSYVVNRRNKPCLSNMKYSAKTTIVDIKELNIEPNDYRKFIDGSIEHIKKREEWEGQDYYLGDGGIYLPSQHQADLVKQFPTLPLFYAISKQLYDMNIHANVQNLNRLWDKLREHADYYIDCRSCTKLFGRIFRLKCTFYDKYESALQRLEPFGVDRRLLGKDKRQLALKKQYESTNGTIKKMTIYFKIAKKHYDTREFHQIVFGERFQPKKGKKKAVGQILERK